jgi:hypothetical protein
MVSWLRFVLGESGWRVVGKSCDLAIPDDLPSNFRRHFPESPSPMKLALAPLLAFALVLVSGCSKPADTAVPAQSGQPPAKRLNIAVIPKGVTHSYWKTAELGVRKAAAELDLGIEW